MATADMRPIKPFRPVSAHATIVSIPDNVILDVFDLYRLPVVEAFSHPRCPWNWYKLAHVCRRWRHLITTSPGRLQIRLICLRDSPIADILRHSPPFPLLIDYDFRYGIVTQRTPRDVDEMLLPFQHMHRLSGVYLSHPPPATMEAVLSSMIAPAPLLEDLCLISDEFGIALPEAPLSGFAPKLRCLQLHNILPPLPTAPNLVDFEFRLSRTEGNLRSSDILHALVVAISVMPQLETLTLEVWSESFGPAGSAIPLLPSNMPISLHKLTKLTFEGSSAYCEVFLNSFCAPGLWLLSISLQGEIHCAIPSFVQFVSKAPKLLQANGAQVGISREGALVDTFGPTPRVGFIEFSIFHNDEGSMMQTIIEVTGLFTRIFPLVKTLIAGLRLGPYGTSEFSFDQTAPYWRVILAKFNAVVRMQIDNVYSEAVADALKQPDSPALLPNVRKIALLFHAYDGHLGPCEILQLFGHFASRRAFTDKPVDTFCKIVTRKDWPRRHDDIVLEE